MTSTTGSQISEARQEACRTISERIVAERQRQRDEDLIDNVIRSGDVVLARYEHNSNELGLLLGMKRFKKCQVEYEQSEKMVRQLLDLEMRVRGVCDYQDAQILLESYEGDMQRILSIPANWHETGAEDALLEELTSGRVQEYVAGLLVGRQEKRSHSPESRSSPRCP
jgi:hypothetical protein